MQLLRREILLAIFLLAKEIISQNKRSRMVFFKIQGRRLDAKKVKEVTGIPIALCLASCLDDKDCQSFNTYQGGPYTDPRCVLFAVDRCSSGAALHDDPDTNYFDTISDEKCPMSEWYYLNFYAIPFDLK